MLHRTHHPFYFPSISSKFISPSLSTATSAYTTTTTTATSQVVKEMECMMKGGFRQEMTVGFSPKQVISDDSCISNSQNAAPVSVAGEDFFVDQLLNLKDEDTIDEDKEDDSGLLVVVKDEPLEEIEVPYTMKVSAFLSPSLETERNRDDFTSVLSIPAEEADLEWLSHFVEDSFSQFSTPYPAGHGPISEQTNPNPEPGSDPKKAPCFSATHALSKSRRSKRARTGGRVWSTALADSSHSSPSTTSSSDPSSPNPDPARRKRQRKRECGPARRCSHCGVQKTPQWRAGPLGPKTLCNACGVRYKSGRLLPEYRPACSPTFSSELHSNNHRKVLEMRKKRELVVKGQPEPRLPHLVESFG